MIPFVDTQFCAMHVNISARKHQHVARKHQHVNITEEIIQEVVERVLEILKNRKGL